MLGLLLKLSIMLINQLSYELLIANEIENYFLMRMPLNNKTKKMYCSFKQFYLQFMHLQRFIGT